MGRATGIRRDKQVAIRKAALAAQPNVGPTLLELPDRVHNVWPLQKDCVAYYGDPTRPGFEQANIIDVICPWQIRCGDVVLQHIRIHRKCAASLARVLNRIWVGVNYDPEEIKRLHYDVYDGSFVLRNKRGGSSLSMHAFGAAIDFDAADNPFHSQKHLFTGDSLLVREFEAEGWVWGGRWSPGSIDGMHFQSARVHP